MIQIKNPTRKLTRLTKQGVQENPLLDQASTKERNRGRIEERILQVYEAQKELKEGWAGLQTIMTLRRIRETKEKKTDVTHYYISSLENKDAKFYLDIIRKHWWIENKLHYVKDVVLKEDSTKFATYGRLKKNAIYRNIAINCIKNKGEPSVKYALEKCANNIQRCWEILRT